jgi:hypothetical protein
MPDWSFQAGACRRVLGVGGGAVSFLVQGRPHNQTSGAYLYC